LSITLLGLLNWSTPGAVVLQLRPIKHYLAVLFEGAKAFFQRAQYRFSRCGRAASLLCALNHITLTDDPLFKLGYLPANGCIRRRTFADP
jgi:hypothetical protein